MAKKFQLFLFMLVIILSLGGASFAQNKAVNNSGNNFGKITNVHGYLGFGVGMPDMQSGIDTPVGKTEIDRSIFAYRMFGGIMLTDWLAIEGQYTDFGTDSAQAIQITDAASYLGTQYNFDSGGRMEARAHSFGISPVLSLNLPYVRPFVKWGYHWWKYQFKASGIIGSTPASFTRNRAGGDMSFGMGLDFKLFPKIWLRVEYDSLPIDQRRSSLSSLNILGIF